MLSNQKRSCGTESSPSPPYAYRLGAFLIAISVITLQQDVGTRTAASLTPTPASHLVVLPSEASELEKNGMILIAITCASDA